MSSRADPGLWVSFREEDTTTDALHCSQPTFPDSRPTATIARVRDMVVRYRPHRLPLPVEGRAQTPREAAGLVAAILMNATVEQVLVLHLDAKDWAGRSLLLIVRNWTALNRRTA